MIFTSTQYLYNSHRSFEFLVYTDYTNIFYLVKEKSGLFCEYFVNIFIYSETADSPQKSSL